MARAQREVSSGRRVNTASDSPSGLAQLMAARSDRAQVQQSAGNLGRVRAEVDAAEQALQGAVQTVDQILARGAQGANGTASAATRRLLADETGSLLEQLGSIANTQVEGRYIFAGDSDQARPYTIDTSVTAAVSAYGGSAATREAAGLDGDRFRVARSARDIFDHATPANNVLASVNALRVALRDNDEAGIRSALGNVRTAAEHLNEQLAFYGNTQNRIQDAQDTASQRQIQLSTRISGLEDADLAEAALELSQARFQQESAMQAEAKRPRNSLFNYLG